MNKSKSQAFGPVLRQFRNERKLTQEELAEKAGVVTSYISMLESSQKFPNLEMLFVLAEALGMSPSELVAAMENALTAASSKTLRA